MTFFIQYFRKEGFSYKLYLDFYTYCKLTRKNSSFDFKKNCQTKGGTIF